MRLPLLLVLAVCSPAAAQFELPIPSVGPKATKFADVGSVKAEIVPNKARPGERVTVRVTVTPKADCWTYPTKTDPAQTGKNKLPPRNGVLVFADPTDPAGAVDKAAVDRTGNDRVYKSAATWELTAWVSKDASIMPHAVNLLDGAGIQICDKNSCFNAKDSDLPAVTLVVAGEPVNLSADDEKAYQAAANRGKKTEDRGSAAGGKQPEEEKPRAGLIRRKPPAAGEYEAKMAGLLASMEKRKVEREGGISALLLTAAFWGLVSLATPCVFPMIPITVSLFLKQSNQSTGGAVKLAAVYSLTIVLVLGLSAMLLLNVFQALSVNPWMNIGLGLLFVVFAFSLFGSFDIVLPNFMLRAAESRRKQGGMVGTVFGAIAFSIVSFTCVAPFLGGFAGMAASGQYSRFELVLAGLAFASAFAAPFFLLALFPSMLKKLPKSGGWLDSVKVVMGFLEVAAALKFFRTAELRLTDTTSFFTYDLVMAGWVVISLACGLYLLNVYRLPHDEEKGHIGVPRLAFALLFLGFAVYLLPAQFKSGGENQRPNGVVFAWVDAFLLPEPKSTGSAHELPWGSDLPDALADAKKNPNRPLVFIDFTGKTCPNCRANENSVFPRPEINALLRQYNLVQMYTDTVPPDFFLTPPPFSQYDAEGEANKAFQEGALGSLQLPLYVILKPTDKGAQVVGVYDEGKINDVAAFTKFLSDPLGK